MSGKYVDSDYEIILKKADEFTRNAGVPIMRARIFFDEVLIDNVFDEK